jgi:prevent-host-death family protein
MIINLSDAKANLSKLVDMAYHGEEITIAKNNLPLVDLVAHKPKGKRTLGHLAGTFTVPDDFCQQDLEIEQLFHGDEP